MIKVIIIFLLIFLTIDTFGQDDRFVVKESIYVGINTGTWFPTNKKNKVLGNPSILGLTIDLKSDKNVFGLNFDLIGCLPEGKTTESIKIKSGDSIIIQNKYSGAQLTFDYGRELAESKRFALEGICSLGYGVISYYTRDSIIDIHKASMVFSPGVSVRYVFGKRWFLQLKTHYCIADYALKDNVSTDLRGHYLITKIIIGGY